MLTGESWCVYAKSVNRLIDKLNIKLHTARIFFVLFASRMAVETLTPAYHILVNQRRNQAGRIYTRGNSSLLLGETLTRLADFENV